MCPPIICLIHKLGEDYGVKKIIQSNILYIVESIIFFALCFFFTPKIDDIIFHYNEFFQFANIKEFIHQTVYYGNGRFLGNGFGILFSKIPEVFYFVEFVLVQVFCFSAEKLIEIKDSKNYFMMIFLLQPIFTVMQVESWLCGFINYFVPILFLVFILLILKNCNNEQSKVKRVFSCIGIVVLGFAEQLFVQHNAVMNLVIAVIVLVVFIRKKKSVLDPVLLIISNIAGLVLLLGYKYYIDFEQTWVYKYSEFDNSPRELAFSLGSISEMANIIVQNIGTFIYFFFSCVVLYTILMMVILHMDKKDKSIKFKKINVLLMFIFYPAALLTFVLCVTDNLRNMKCAVVLGGLFVLNIIGFGYSLIKAVFMKLSFKLKIKTAMLMFYSLASVVPFIIYSHTSIFRGYFFFYLFICFMVLIVADFAKKEYGFNFEKQIFLFSICACIVCVGYISAFYESKCAYNYKTEHVLPSGHSVFGDSDMFWVFAEGNIDHEFIPYKEFKEMQK